MKPTRGNLFFLLTLIYSIIFPYALGLLSYFVPSIGEFFVNLSTPNLIFFSQLLIVFLPTVIYFTFTGEDIIETIPIDRLSISNTLYILGISLFIIPVMLFLGVIGESFEPNKISESALDLLNYPYLLGLLTMAVIPAIFEELFMRGAVLSNYRNIPIFKASLINGFFFGVFHTNMQQFFYAALLGFIFSYFVYYTKSIFSVILSHFIINGINVTYLYLLNKLFEYLDLNLLEESSKVAANTDTFNTIIILFFFMIPFACIASMLMYFFVRSNETRLQQAKEEQANDFDYEIEQSIYYPPVDVVECSNCIDKYFIAIIIIFLVYTTLSVLGIVA